MWVSGGVLSEKEMWVDMCKLGDFQMRPDQFFSVGRSILGILTSPAKLEDSCMLGQDAADRLTPACLPTICVEFQGGVYPFSRWQADGGKRALPDLFRDINRGSEH